eukprot:scaffold21566_cov73-Cyclotella_meneghiniana.AAC.2
MQWLYMCCLSDRRALDISIPVCHERKVMAWKEGILRKFFWVDRARSRGFDQGLAHESQWKTRRGQWRSAKASLTAQ